MSDTLRKRLNPPAPRFPGFRVPDTIAAVNVTDDSKPLWRNSAICEVTAPNGVAFRIEVSTVDAGLVAWQVFRVHEQQIACIAGGHGATQEAAKLAALHALARWRDKVEGV